LVSRAEAIRSVESKFLRQDLPEIHVGDTVRVYVKVVEGNRERTQVFQGLVIRIRGGGLRKTFTVRKVVAGEGVERIFPYHAPVIEKIEVIRRGKVRRAKLYYLRKRIGKAAMRVEELREAPGKKVKTEAVAEPEAEVAPETQAQVEAEAKAEAEVAPEAEVKEEAVEVQAEEVEAAAEEVAETETPAPEAEEAEEEEIKAQAEETVAAEAANSSEEEASEEEEQEEVGEEAQESAEEEGAREG